MRKGKGGTPKSSECWGSADFERRAENRWNKSKTAKAQEKNLKHLKQVHKLSHGTRGKLEEKKLLMQIRKTQREVELTRERLTAWDAEGEAKLEQQRQEEEEKKRKAELDLVDGKKKRRKRPGPETWKLKGAARPAHEVYDFDVRYVDPHMKEHEEAAKRAKRQVNVLKVYRGRLGSEEAPQPVGRKFLSQLMQLGLLQLEAKKFKGARESFKECMELDGDGENSITVARQRLMRLYLEANKPASARRMWEKLPEDRSAWIRYAAALVEYVSWNILEEKGSNEQTAEDLLSDAIQCNPFCAYYLAFHSKFEEVMEYVDEIEDADAGTLEEAIEYCSSEQVGHWIGTDGAIDWIRKAIKRILNGGVVGKCKKSDLESWSTILTKIEYEYESSHQQENQQERQFADDDDDATDDNLSESSSEPDILMYAGMFRTAMEMIQDSGELHA